MLRVGRRRHELSLTDGQQIVQLHQPFHSLVVHQQTFGTQRPRDTPYPVMPPMCNEQELNLVPQLHFLFVRLHLLPVPVEPRPADFGQATESLDVAIALQLRHSFDLLVDADTTAAAVGCHRWARLCESTWKTSTSTVFSAKAGCKHRMTTPNAPSRSL